MDTYTQLLLQLMCSIKHPLKPIWDASSLAFIVPQMGVRMGVRENTFIECLGMVPKIKWRIVVNMYSYGHWILITNNVIC